MKTTIPKLSQLIADQKFDWVNLDITDDLFPAPKEIGIDFKLFHFDKYIFSENAVKKMEKDGYRAANIYELLIWKEWNNKDWIVALGSVPEADGIRYVPALLRYDSGRGLNLRWWGLGWSARYRFLGVRNLSSESKTFRTSNALGNFDPLVLEARVAKIEKWIHGVKDKSL